ncbi:MAG: beta-propeller domain-containing protein [Pyrinomonadaceae bacterium]
MKTTILILAAALLLIPTAVADNRNLIESAPDVGAAATKRLKPFISEAELNRYFGKIAKSRKRNSGSGGGGGGGTADQQVVSVSAGSAMVDVNASAGEESITNVQHAGVDEGGIVKLHGSHLVVLRRGRLFTISTAGDEIKPISTINAFAPDIDPDDTWYDEMLISGDTIVVIGFSYARGGTEIGLFRIGGKGDLHYRSTYHLRSNDYYSSRHYSSRLIGRKLIFYSPLEIDLTAKDVLGSFPALRRWHKGAKDSEFERIAPATQIYRPVQEIEADDDTVTLHTVTTCDLSDGGMSCTAKAVMGPSGNVFYVSLESVYVWATEWDYSSDKGRNHSFLYRMPLEGAEPGALQVSGGPVDQFSFLERDGRLNVLVRSESSGDGMWKADAAEGDVALMSVQVGGFSDGREAVPAASYRQLLKPEGYNFQNRFIGGYLLYGTGNGWTEPKKSKTHTLYAVPLGGGAVSELALPHGVDRIEALGRDAIVVGTHGKDLHFTSIRLDAAQPSVSARYAVKGASQGELRSHGFFYKPKGRTSGIVGLPVRGPGRPGYDHLVDDSASIIFLRNESLDLSEIGELKSRPETAVDDGCRASCVDWYGNARPLFLGDRVFALMGYELVEGSFRDGRIKEIGRSSFAPVQPGRAKTK